MVLCENYYIAIWLLIEYEGTCVDFKAPFISRDLVLGSKILTHLLIYIRQHTLSVGAASS
jgi:hypothetical protein